MIVFSNFISISCLIVFNSVYKYSIEAVLRNFALVVKSTLIVGLQIASIVFFGKIRKSTHEVLEELSF